MSAPSYAWDFSFLWQYRWLILVGLGITILYTIGTILLGLAIGLLTGLLRLSRNKLLTAPLVAYVEIFRCTPLLVQIIWFYYALPVILGIDIPAHMAAILVLSLYTGAFYAEIVRGGVNSIERGQWDAARAIGMRRRQVMRHVILPQAVKRMIPAFLERAIELMKTTTLVATIAYADLLFEANEISQKTFRPLETFTVVALIYFVVIFAFSLLTRQFERRLAVSGESTVH